MDKEKRLKTEAIYLVTPDEKSEVNLDDVMKAVNEITDTVKDNDATDVAQEVAETPIIDEDPVMEDEEIIDVSEEPAVEVEAGDDEPVDITDIIDVSKPDATETALDAATVPSNGITSDVQADETVIISDEEINKGILFNLSEQLMSAYFTVSSLHRNLVGNEWFEGHEKLEDYANKLLEVIDEVIEQNLALNGIEPSIQEIIDAYPPEAVCGRDKVESYRIVRDLFNSIVTLMEECKSGLPGDVISKIEEFQNYFRKEAEYKLSKTILGESKLMTSAEFKKERILEGKFAQVKIDAKEDALNSGDDQYIYQDGDEVYYTDESPKKNPSLFKRVKLLGKFVTDMENGKMVVNYYTEGEEPNKIISKFKRRLTEETESKDGEVAGIKTQGSIDYVGPDNNPELEEIAGDKISFEEFKKQHKDEIDVSYKNTYGDEINKDLYDALADYMYNDSLTGNIQTKEDYVNPVEETDANEDLVNDEDNK